MLNSEPEPFVLLRAKTQMTPIEAKPCLTALAMDQAALVGFVSRLHGLGLPLLLVEHVCVEEDRSSVSHKPQV
jgi:hypothetical protein